MKKTLRKSILFAILFLLGCAGTPFKAGTPWDPNEEPFFDDGVDLVENYSGLSGSWAYEQENNFDGRVQLADLIAIVQIESIQTVTDFEGRAAKRIDVKVVKTLHGEVPSPDIQLLSRENSIGHELILRYENRLNGRFLAFVRWFEAEDRTLKHHFHLSPDSQSLIDEIGRRIKIRQREEEAREANAQ